MTVNIISALDEPDGSHSAKIEKDFWKPTFFTLLSAVINFAMTFLIGGIEGGSTGSRMVLLDSVGKQQGYAEGPSTNPWLLGLEEVAKRILSLIDKAFNNSGLQFTEPLVHLGLSLSGADTETNQKELVSAIKVLRPNVAQEIHICNDSIGTFLTVCDSDAIVLVCGTGSVCNYIRRNLTFQRVGGYGHMLGDNGSAYWIALRVIKKLIEADDKITDTVFIWIIKSKIAGVCEHLSMIARTGDQLSKDVFRDAGVQLARHVRGALYYAAMDSKPQNVNMTVICCGSVFKSWDLIKDGFCDFLKPTDEDNWSGTLTLVQLKSNAAYGAARLSVYYNPNLFIPILKGSSVKFDEFIVGIRF
ncbi:unnamed protein product [Heterobilharzia americana]|nr:unnamed protein product [Heterobilharzia americana]